MNDPYFDTRAAEMGANIVRATLLDLGEDLFTGMTPMPDGTVIADLRSGSVLHLAWCVTHQRIETVKVSQPADQIIEVTLAA
jgi:hypothetical protein